MKSNLLRRAYMGNEKGLMLSDFDHEMQRGRKSNFELLRIIAMVMIIAYHYAIHGQADLIRAEETFQRVYLEMFSMFGKIGVNLFVMLAGYFGIYKKSSTIKRIVNIEFQTVFFSVSLLLIAWISGMAKVPVTGFIKACLPTIFNQYWYITAFIVILLFTPWLNPFLSNLSKKDFFELLSLCIVIWSIISCLTFQRNDGMNWTQQIWMFVTYMMGAYIRRFGDDPIYRRGIKGTTAILTMLLLGSVMLLEFLGIWIEIARRVPTYFRWSNTIIAVPLSVSIFLCFKNLKMKTYPLINILAKGSLGVYLFHENRYISPLLWRFICYRGNERFLLVLNSFFSLVIIYFMGFGFDLLWEFLNKRLSPVYKSCENVIMKGLRIFDKCEK